MSRQPHTPRLLGLAGAAVLTTGLLVSAPGGAVADETAEADGVTAQSAPGVAARNTAVRTEKQLRRAVRKANGNDSADTIRVARPITLKGTKDLPVTSDLTVIGTTLKAKRSRFFDVTDGGSLTLRGIALRGGRPGDAESGGAVKVSGEGSTLTLREVVMRGNRVSGEAASGGAVFNDQATLVVVDSFFRGNRSERAGGAIEANAGSTTIENSRFVRNRTGAVPGNGGAFHLTGAGTVDVTDSSFLRNIASAEGGGVWNSADGVMTVTGGRFVGNVARGDEATNGGGGLFNDGGELTVADVTVRKNRATGEAGSGGGLLNDLGTVDVSGSTFHKNVSNRAGGAVEANEGDTTLTDVTMTENRTGDAPGNGGGVHLTGMGTVTMNGGAVTGNVAAAEGGGLWNSATGFFTATGVDIADNEAPDGPDTFNDGGVFLVDGVPVGVLPELPLPIQQR